MNYKTVERLTWTGLIAAVLLVVVIVFKACGGRNQSGRAFSVPYAGVGSDTLAVIKMDLRLLGDDASVWQKIPGLGADMEQMIGALPKLRLALAGHGVSQALVPVNLGWSTFERAGVYLGGQIKGSDEEIETAILEAGGGTLIGASALLSSISSAGGGWRFWGVGGGKISSPDRSVAKRYESVFRAAGPAPFQIVVLGSSEGAAKAEDNPQTPRLLRQLNRLSSSARGMLGFRFALIPENGSRQNLRIVAGAFFDSEKSAQKFVASWKAIATDLSLAAGSADQAKDSGNIVLQAFAGMADRLGAAAPVLERRWIRWEIP